MKRLAVFLGCGVVLVLGALFYSRHLPASAAGLGRDLIDGAVRAIPDPGTDPHEAAEITLAESTTRARASYLAGSEIEDTRALGGFGRSSNYPKRVGRGSAGSGLYLFAEPDRPVPITTASVDFSGTSVRPHPYGMRLTLVNRTDTTMS
jgi:hypothetical protein